MLVIYFITLLINSPFVAIVVFIFVYIIIPLKILGFIYTVFIKKNLYKYTLKKKDIYYLLIIVILLFITIFLYKKLYLYSLQGDVSDKREYSEIYVNNIKKQMIHNLLNKDKKTRTKLGLNTNETELKSKYLLEYNKFQEYCLTNSKFCQIEINVSYNNWFSKLILSPDEKESSITYKFDKDSFDFFNSIQQNRNNYKSYYINENKFFASKVIGYKAVQFKPSDFSSRQKVKLKKLEFEI